MAEYFVGPVMEKLIDACFEYLKDQVRWQTGMKEELQKLRDIHPQIQAVVSAYSQVEIKDPALNKWLWKLRDALDAADDVLDEIEYIKLEKQMSKNKKIRKVRSLMKSLKKSFVKIGKRALKIDRNLKRLEVAVQNLYKISAEVTTFLHLLDRTKQEQQQLQLELQKKRKTGSMPTNDLIGRSKEMEFVRQWLRKPYQTDSANADLYSKISLLSVIGLGGIGKTTLLQHVYEDGVTKEFDVKMWACVSNNFDVETVISNILKSLKEQVSNEDPLEALQRSLQTKVTSKRFLLVLDDIWEADETKWKNVLAPLHFGSSGSIILITTRMGSVASMFAKMIKKSNETLPLKGLEEDDFLQLFSTHAFAGVENPDDKLTIIAGKMVKKLSRCPLAAKVIGGILNFNLDECYWTKVLNTNIANVGSGQSNFIPILKLSYIYLPKCLQNCFSFCCIFPQDHEFDKDDLVRMWIALGFVQYSNIQGETLEDIGRRYFDILVKKSFFDEVRTDDRVYYLMHDLLHELAQSVSTQQCFKVVDDKEFPIPPDTIRHLYINTHSSRLESTFQKLGKFKNLHSLFLSSVDGKYDENVISEILKASKSIRLLALNFRYLLEISETIGCLTHLRYLKVESYFALKLPKSISHVYHLQFIISKWSPDFEMNKIGWKELMPNENCQLIMDEIIIKNPSELLIEPLKSISSLRLLTVKENDELVSFPSETEQWFPQFSSSLFRLELGNLKSLQSLPSSLESLSSLEILKAYYVPQLKLLPNLPASLVKLDLVYLQSLQCLPSSLSTISSLNFLQLINIPLLKSLPGLPSSLSWLILIKHDNLDCLPSCLPTLHTFIIKILPRLMELPDLPSSLIKLELEELESLKCLPSSLSAISSLDTLKLKDIPLLRSLSDLPSSLKYLEFEELKSLQQLPSSLSTISSLTRLKLKCIPLLKSLPDLPSSLEELGLEYLTSLQCLPSSLSTISSLTQLKLKNIRFLKTLPDLPSSLINLYLSELKSLQCLPSSLSTISSLTYLELTNIPFLKSLPDLPSSLISLYIEELDSLQCLPFSLSTISSLKSLGLNNIPVLKSLPDLPSSLNDLEIYELESLLCLPFSLSTISSLKSLELRNIPLLKSLPDLPSTLSQLILTNLENLDCLSSYLPTTLFELRITEVPRLLELPDLPASLHHLSIEDSHPQLMKRYENFYRR